MNLKKFNALSLDEQLVIFRTWRKISTDPRKHWCLNEIKTDEKLVKKMVKDVENYNKHLNT